jgi:eukaryotic-like serine/threonine-protein kinase
MRNGARVCSASEKRMNDLDQLAQDQAALAIYRRTLAYCLDEQAKFGPRYLPPSIIQSMLEARENIRHIKSRLRARGIVVADWPNDGTPLPIQDKRCLDASVTSPDERSDTEVAAHALDSRAPAKELLLDAGIPTDSLEDTDQRLEAKDGSAGQATIVEAIPPPTHAPRISGQPQSEAIAMLPGYVVHAPVAQTPQVTVYRGTELHLNRPVLVHVLHVINETVAHRFDGIRPVVMQLRHPNLLPIVHIGRDEQLGAYLISQYMEARSVEELLRRGPLDPLLALRIFSQIGAALDVLHANGVVHGNVDPTLVFMTPDGRAYLVGVPLVNPVDTLDPISHKIPNDDTTETPLAPHSSPAAPTSAEDLAKLGVLLYSMLRGQAPIPDQDPAPLVASDPTLAGVDSVIRTLRAPDSTKRYASAEQATAALRLAFPQQIVGLVDYLQAASWQAGARWLENPLEAELGSLLAEEFLTRSRARANTLHRDGAIAQLLAQRRSQHWLRRVLPGPSIQPEQIRTYNLYCYELRIHYETRSALHIRERALDDQSSVPERASQDLWTIAVPYVEPFVDVLPAQLTATYIDSCATCRSTTEVICAACAGTGVIESARLVTYYDGTTSAATCREPCLACHTHGRLRCIRCKGLGKLLYEQTFTWSRRGRIYFNEDDLSGLPLRTVARHAQQIFRSAIDPHDPRWHATPPLRELLVAAVNGGGPDSQAVAADLIIRGVPMTEVDYVSGKSLRSLTLIGFENRPHMD